MASYHRTLITGSVAYDVLLGYDGSFADAMEEGDIDHLSVSFFAPRYARHHGGTGANIAWNLRMLGGDPLLVSSVGARDGGAYKALLEERGIDTKYLELVPKQVTATAIIGTDTSERQIAFFHPGADAHGTWPDLWEDRDDIVCAIISPRDPVAMMQAAEWCQKTETPYIFDPGQQVIGLGEDELKSCVSHAKGVITNAYEWDLLSARLNMSTEAVMELSGLLIVTQGDKGATIYTKQKTYVVPVCPAEKVVNPTGAGDAFRAGLLYGMSRKWDILSSARLGSVMGSLVVGIEGTLLPNIDREAVWARAEEVYGAKEPTA